jgi:hypothetical protein
LIGGYQVSQAIHVAAKLGIADALADGPRTSDEIAAATETYADSLYRLLRALASVGVVHEEDGRSFSLTPVGDHLRSDASASLAGWATFIGVTSHWQAWGDLEHSVRTGESAFRHVHGADVWDYRTTHLEESAVFDRAMQSLTRAAQSALTEAFDFSRFRTVCDVGGGNGALVAAILPAYPQLQGVVFDQAHVVADAERVLESAGVAERCQIVAGDFFDEVPEADAHILKSVLLDWEDEEAAAILRNCARATEPGGAVLVIDRMIGEANEGPLPKFSDLNMLVAPGGRVRTLDEFRRLFEAADLELDGVTPTASELNIIEARPVRTVR